MASIHKQMRVTHLKIYKKQHNILQELCVIATDIPDRNMRY
jgi:hypothetical protein